MNSRAKGRRTELKAVRELKDEGWLVYQVKGSTKFNKSVDIFGLWDILAIKKVIRSTLYKFIQVKTNQKPSFIPFKDFTTEFQDDYNSFEVWVWKDREGFTRYKL